MKFYLQGNLTRAIFLNNGIPVLKLTYSIISQREPHNTVLAKWVMSSFPWSVPCDVEWIHSLTFTSTLAVESNHHRVVKRPGDSFREDLLHKKKWREESRYHCLFLAQCGRCCKIGHDQSWSNNASCTVAYNIHPHTTHKLNHTHLLWFFLLEKKKWRESIFKIKLSVR